MSRRTVRERVLQVLYQLEFQPQEEARITDELSNDLSEEMRIFYSRILQGIRTHQEEIDPMIEKYLREGWSLNRIATLDRAVLRIAMFELIYEKNTPPKVVINEAVEMAKMYSGEESSSFINGCLGNWYREQVNE